MRLCRGLKNSDLGEKDVPWSMHRFAPTLNISNVAPRLSEGGVFSPWNVVFNKVLRVCGRMV